MTLSSRIRNIALLLLSLATCFQFALAALPAQAQLSPTDDALNVLQNTKLAPGQSTAQSAQQLPFIIGSLIRVVLSLLGIIFLILLVYAGFLWMTAAGDSKKVDTAKAILKQAVIGIIILTLAYAISAFVISSILNAANP